MRPSTTVAILSLIAGVALSVALPLPAIHFGRAGERSIRPPSLGPAYGTALAPVHPYAELEAPVLPAHAELEAHDLPPPPYLHPPTYSHSHSHPSSPPPISPPPPPSSFQIPPSPPPPYSE